MFWGHDSDKFHAIARERKYRVRSEMKLLPAGHLTVVRRVQFPNEIILRR